MEAYIKDINADLVTIDHMQIFMLLFADDTVLFSYSLSGLQALLNKLHNYCVKWNITVNTAKTVAMVCKSGNNQERFDVYYDNTRLNVVNKFCYLGVMLTSNGKFYNVQKALSEQALRALFTLNSLFDVVPVALSEKLKLFDSMILPILNYGCEIWGFHNSPDIEKVYVKFLKQILHVRQQTTNVTVYGEVGRVPLNILRKERIIKYFYKIINTPDVLVYKSFMDSKINNVRGSWAIEVKTLLENLGFAYVWAEMSFSKQQLNAAIETLYCQYYQRFYSSVDTMPKLCTYKLFKNL
jgi:hypothetical protein